MSDTPKSKKDITPEATFSPEPPVTSGQPKERPKEQTPSIGRNVHYMWGDRHCAAIITNDKENEYEKGKWNQMLIVFPRNEAPIPVVAQYDPDCANGTWHWQEYVA